MAMPIKFIKDWEHILLDTTVLCDLFLSELPETTDTRSLFAKKLITYLSKTKTASGKDRVFYISAITVSELLTQEHDSEKIRRILRVINSKNVEFIEFDLTVALEFNHRLQPYLQRNSLHEMAAKIGFRLNDYMMAREWVARDYMILMSGLVKNVDVVLSSDKKSFYHISRNVENLYTVLVYPELFEQSEQYILSYYDDKVDDFLRK